MDEVLIAMEWSCCQLHRYRLQLGFRPGDMMQICEIHDNFAVLRDKLSRWTDTDRSRELISMSRLSNRAARILELKISPVERLFCAWW